MELSSLTFYQPKGAADFASIVVCSLEEIPPPFACSNQIKEEMAICIHSSVPLSVTELSIMLIMSSQAGRHANEEHKSKRPVRLYQKPFFFPVL